MKNVLFLFLLFLAHNGIIAQSPSHDLHFSQLANVWDEGIPLGNGMVGALVWKKGENLRFSLDRADVWDMRPMRGLHRKEFSYRWVQEQVRKNDYKIVQEYFDTPYDIEPAPSKIPAGALEFNLGETNVIAGHLSLKDAVCEVRWEGGIILKTFVHATEPVGWFRFENISAAVAPQLVAPEYEGKITGGEVNSLVGDDLARLGYKQGKIQQEDNRIIYHQEGARGFAYEIAIQWKRPTATTLEGVWSISAQDADKKINPLASTVTSAAQSRGYTNDYTTHVAWWKNFWCKSSIEVPDPLLEKQWYLELYKFGAAARRGAPPISLQAVWTADNGRIPPWKGDFHHDLNTQLSYWPAYSGNHLDEALSYLDHLEGNKANYKRYTKMYFGAEGLAVPGVTTLDGTEMGGWIQYSLSPTISAWLSHHFYLQWRYSMDRHFLEKSAYPWIRDVSVFLENITELDKNGHRKLPISSSPEINDNDISAWFLQNTNYDLALMKFNFHIAAELAKELGLISEAEHWKKILSEFDDFALSDNNELMFAPTMPYNQSHRHFSNAMAIHPLGLIKYEDGDRPKVIIKNTVQLLDSIGPDLWCGYSYSWLANLKARAKDGEGATKALEIFARAFCLPNSFHANGDQTKSGYSKFTYRPFTLEGNFAFAAGLQEMLLQSYAGFIEIMPAVPSSWKNISFKQLRAEGAFLVDAIRINGQLDEIKIVAEKGGKTKMKLPFENWIVVARKDVTLQNTKDGFVTLTCGQGGQIILKNKD